MTSRTLTETLVLIESMRRSVELLRSLGHVRAAQSLADAIARREVDLPEWERTRRG